MRQFTGSALPTKLSTLMQPAMCLRAAILKMLRRANLCVICMQLLAAPAADSCRLPASIYRQTARNFVFTFEASTMTLVRDVTD